MKKQGIYILTNEGLKGDTIKIGYSDDIDRRIKELDKSSSIPTEFQLYAWYDVGSRLQDKQVHKLLDIINPGLRINKSKEFFDFKPEAAYEIFAAMAKIHSMDDRLHKAGDETDDEPIVTPIIPLRSSKVRKPRMQELLDQHLVFIGDELYLRNHPAEIATLKSADRVYYDGREMGLYEWALLISGYKAINSYENVIRKADGELLDDKRKRMLSGGVAEPAPAVSVDADFISHRQPPARLRKTAKGFLLLKGSHIVPQIWASCPLNIRKMRTEYAEMIGADHVLMLDLSFGSLSAAASFVTGSSVSGNVFWQATDNGSLKENDV